MRKILTDNYGPYALAPQLFAECQEVKKSCLSPRRHWRYRSRVIMGIGFWTDARAAAVLFVLAGVIFAVMVGFAMSPAGRPIPSRRRAGGFSRALADRAGGEGDTE